MNVKRIRTGGGGFIVLSIVAVGLLVRSAPGQLFTVTAQNRTLVAQANCPGANCVQDTAAAPDFNSWTDSVSVTLPPPVYGAAANQTSNVSLTSFTGNTRASSGSFSTSSSAQFSWTFTPTQFIR